MNSAAIHGRHRFVQGLRDLADWLETDATIPAPDDLLVGIRMAAAADVEAFARVHRLGEPHTDAHGTTHVSKRFGTVTYRVYAPTGKKVPR